MKRNLQSRDGDARILAKEISDLIDRLRSKQTDLDPCEVGKRLKTLLRRMNGLISGSWELDELLAVQPRLEGQIRRIRRRRSEIKSILRRLAREFREPEFPKSEMPLLRLLDLLDIHVTEERDLIFEAYWADMGGEGAA